MVGPISLGLKAKKSAAFEIQVKALKETPRVCHPMTAPVVAFDIVVEASDEAAGQRADEVVGDLIHPVLQRRQEAVKATQLLPSSNYAPQSIIAARLQPCFIPVSKTARYRGDQASS
jgi:hypothetical protein